MDPHRDRLGEDESAGHVQVCPHPGWIDDEGFERAGDRDCRLTRSRDKFGNRVPLGLPPAETAFMLLQHG